MTGGGQFIPTDGSCAPKDQFGNFGGNVSGTAGGTDFKGHFNYLNHCTNLKINGNVTAVDNVMIDPNTGLTLQMTFEVAYGSGCIATVIWHDTAEPGANQDTIALTISGTGCTDANQTTSSGIAINKGNIQGHRPNDR